MAGVGANDVAIAVKRKICPVELSFNTYLVVFVVGCGMTILTKSDGVFQKRLAVVADMTDIAGIFRKMGITIFGKGGIDATGKQNSQ